MVENHLSRLAAPKSWQIKKKGIKWVAKPLPGPHPIKLGVPLLIIFRDLLNYAKTSKEVKTMLYNNEIFVDGKRRKEPKFIVGLMDVISVPKTKTYFRVLLSRKGKISVVGIKEDEINTKPCQIIGKRLLKKGKLQLNLFDGKNILVEKDDYEVGDTVLIELPSQKIKEVFKFQKSSLIYLTGGKHTGEVGVIENIKEDTVVYKRDKSTFETLKEYVFVIGKNKPIISLLEK